MASPVAVRHALSQRSINTHAFYATTAPASTTSNLAGYKPSLATRHKRSHSQITSGQENIDVQQQILGAALKSSRTRQSKQTPQQQQQTQKRPTVADTCVKPINQLQSQPSQFKHPPPKRPNGSEGKTRERKLTQDTIAPQEEDKEMIEWRKSIRRTLSMSTFYMDGLEEVFKEQATRWITRHGGVRLPCQNQY